MDRSLALAPLLMLIAADGGPPSPPTLLGISPPGAPIDGRAIWTIKGRDLLGAAGVVVDPPGGLRFESAGAAADGSTLTIIVEADPDAAPGVRAVRVDGPGGVSNPLLVRVDPLSQSIEADRTADAPPQVVPVGTAVAGTLRALDVDRYRVEGPPGRVVALDWEARRLGMAIDPLLAATGPEGEALGAARADPTIGGDARLVLAVPRAGWFEVMIRDNTYRGSSRAHYRLRVVPDPPPDPPAAPDDPRLNHDEPIAPGPGGLDLRGTLAAPGEVDRLRVAARAGERLRVWYRAPGGSPLDPVVALRDAASRVLVEADDTPRPPGVPDSLPLTDARLDFTPGADGPLTVEVADRSGGGGPAFGFALEVGPPCDDLALLLLPPESGPASAWNLRPGESAEVPLVIVPEGYPGTIEVRAEGLPAGVEAEPIVVRTAPPRRPGARAAATAPWDAPPVVDALRLRVAPGLAPARGSMRVVAHRLARGGEPGPDRVATLAVPLDAGTGAPRPIWHRLDSIPVRVVADPAR